MKKSILAFAFFCATSVAFANTPLIEDSSKKVEKTETSESAEKPKVIVQCSATVSDGKGGTQTVYASGGNWFTSAETAGSQCARNLADAVNGYNATLQQNPN